MQRPKQKVSLLVNIISPARIATYSGLAEHFDLQILHGGIESNRDSWRNLDDSLPNATVKCAWGWQIASLKKVKGRPFDRQYIHITPGYIHHLLSFQPDAVITSEMGLRTLMALAYGALFRRPVWVWWGGTLHTERGIGCARRVLRGLIARVARHWISYGSTSTEYLRSLRIPAGRILEIQNSVDERLFTSNAKPLFETKPRPVVLHVGQFILRKGVEPLLHAAAALQSEGAVFSLLLVGSGPAKQALQGLARSLNLKNCHFHPAQPPDRMPSVYRSADVLVFPTLADVWGLVANEAMLSGIPVLCSKYAGCATELFPGENIFDPTCEEEFKEKLQDAIAGRLPKPDCSRLRTTSQIVNRLVRALESSMRMPSDRIPATNQEGAYQ